MKKTQDANKKIAKQAAENKSMESPWRLAMKRLSRNKLAIAGLIFLGVMIVLCIVGPIVSPYSDITATDIANAKQPPSAQHWFGTDENGRDVFTRLLYGGRISMTVGLAATALQIFIGALLGCTAAYYGGVVDFVIMRVVDVILSLPTMPILIMLSAMMSDWKVDTGVRVYYLMVILAAIGWAVRAGISEVRYFRSVRWIICQQRNHLVSAICIRFSNILCRMLSRSSLLQQHWQSVIRSSWNPPCLIWESVYFLRCPAGDRWYLQEQT